MLPGRDIDHIVSVFDVRAIKHKERSSSHRPADGPACMNIHLSILAFVQEVAVGFEVESVHMRQADSWQDV